MLLPLLASAQLFAAHDAHDSSTVAFPGYTHTVYEMQALERCASLENVKDDGWLRSALNEVQNGSEARVPSRRVRTSDVQKCQANTVFSEP